MPIGSRGAYTFVDVLLAIILPPLGVFLKFGLRVSIIRPLAFPLYHLLADKNFRKKEELCDTGFELASCVIRYYSICLFHYKIWSASGWALSCKNKKSIPYLRSAWMNHPKSLSVVFLGLLMIVDQLHLAAPSCTRPFENDAAILRFIYRAFATMCERLSSCYVDCGGKHIGSLIFRVCYTLHCFGGWNGCEACPDILTLLLWCRRSFGSVWCWRFSGTYRASFMQSMLLLVRPITEMGLVSLALTRMV